MKVAILFDMDGTVLNTIEDLADSVNASLAHYGYPERTLDEVRRFVGNGVRRLMRQAVPTTATDAQMEEVLRYYHDYYEAHCQIKTRPYDGIVEILQQLGKRYPVAIVSNKPDGAVKILAAQYFPGVYALGESPACPRKPAPDMVFQAMKALEADACVYVGDSEVDVLTAKNAEVPCLSVTWGFRDVPELEEAGAKYFCHDTARLQESLDAIVSEVYGQ